MIPDRLVEVGDNFGRRLYRVAIVLNGLVAAIFLIEGRWWDATVPVSMCAILYCTTRLRDFLFERLDRWRDRKIAEIHAKYRGGEEHDGR